MNDTELGFYIHGEPELTPLEELEHLASELNRHSQKNKELREQEEQIFDSKIYIKNGDHFEEVALLKRTVKTAQVLLPSGTKQCLSGKHLDEEGKYTRHFKKMDREFLCGWRARSYLWSRIEETEGSLSDLKGKVIPNLVRSIRDSSGNIPKEIVRNLVPHYRSVG